MTQSKISYSSNQATNKKYEGRRINGRAHVIVDGQPLKVRLDLKNHSPDGFEWGYGGSGPAQLSLALLADCLGDDELARRYYHDFMRKIVENLPRNGWNLTAAQVLQSVREFSK